MSEITDQTLERTFLNILDQGSGDTHRYALARFLLDYDGDPRVSPGTIAEYFFRYYWFQTAAARLRQVPDDYAAAAIRDCFSPRHHSLTADDILKEQPDAASECIGRIARHVDDEAEKFQKVRDGRGAREEKIFFEYKMGPGIEMRPGAQEFLGRHAGRLRHAVILEWSRVLEEANPGIPGIFEKIEGAIPQKSPLSLKKKVLEPHFGTCFYCEGPLAGGRAARADHVIPAEFVADDNMWNLVLACRNCSQIKRGSLPPKSFLGRLFQRNNEYQHRIPELKRSANRLGDSEEEVARVITEHYDNAAASGFAAVRYMG